MPGLAQPRPPIWPLRPLGQKLAPFEGRGRL